MVLLAVISAKNIELLVEKCRSMVLYLRCLDVLIVLVALSVSFVGIRQVVEEPPQSTIPCRHLILVLIAFSDQNPFEPLRCFLSGSGN